MSVFIKQKLIQFAILRPKVRTSNTRFIIRNSSKKNRFLTFSGSREFRVPIQSRGVKIFQECIYSVFPTIDS